MSITSTRNRLPAVVPSTLSPVEKPAVQEKARAQGAKQPGLDGRSSFTPAAARGAVELTGASRPAPLARRLDPASPEGTAAVRATLKGLAPQLAAPGMARGTLSEAANAFKPFSVERDGLGMTHVRMNRLHEGVRVFGEQVIGHLDSAGKMMDFTGSVSRLPKGLGRQAVKLTPEQAVAAASARHTGGLDREPTVERVIYEDAQGNHRNAYHVEMANTSRLKDDERPHKMNYLVDANSGKVLESFNQMGGIELPHEHGHEGHAPGLKQAPPAPGTREPGDASRAAGGVPGERDDNTLYSGNVDLATTANPDGTYKLEDSTRGQGVVTQDARNRGSAFGAVDITDTNDVWGEATDSTRTQAALDAHYGAQMTYDFYKDVLGRDSIDGNGEQLRSNVHINRDYVNAYWDGQQMNYGDGDGLTSGPLTTLDIAGHEITHGLTERTAGLLYRNESGALNEAMSDIMGTGVEWYASQQNSAVRFDYAVGEDAWTPTNGDSTDALRYMDDPTRDGVSPDHYSKRYTGTADNGGVHINSGIANNAFYLLAEGGTQRTSGKTLEQGIGIEKGLKIFGRALEYYMTPNTNFAQARQATLKAATDLYGADSVEVRRVGEAWSAVGVEARSAAGRS